ncbi:MAG: bifunctional UDP-N-acetylglucosamine diphosphorylase/glucosamine-1-phosphate N-acetyltransferase GlmU [Anaerolineales bacterium]|nr:bifunctional UDP-N-acetylglucosamine diphosphorylase/glucosamine-1-phosphate N-acetyltransferase GlmU [Anaerolineales bacterium]
MNTTGVILAAGQGTRMKSKLHKVLHPILGKPMIWYALDAMRQASDGKPVVVIGNQAEQVRESVGEDAQFVLQAEQFGTGHAVMQAEAVLKDKTDLVLVTYADMPLLRPETLKRLVSVQKENSGPMSLATIIAEDPRGFGRIVRDKDNSVLAIVEETAANEDQLKIKELNVSVYCFQADWLWQALDKITLSAKEEYYLTDVVEIAVAEGHRVEAVVLDDPAETIGINTRVHLAEAAQAMQERINKNWMLKGISIPDPDSTYIEPDVIIGTDTVIYPNTHLQGNSEIGEDAVIGPNTIILDSKVGDRCVVLSSIIEYAVMDEEANIGPFGHLRKGARMGKGAHMGNFGEMKNSYLGPGAKMGHFSYLGDATVGENANIGAGTITCNYDGEKKHPTIIGENAFIGSDSMLVAPLNIGKNAKTGAGSVVTKDVPEGTTVVGVPAVPIKKKRTSRES